MTRLSTDRRTDDPDQSSYMVWDGSAATAEAITAWSANSSLTVRFQCNLNLHEPDQARTFVERPFPESAEWVITPVGSVITRRGRDEDAPLTVTPPPTPEQVLEEK